MATTITALQIQIGDYVSIRSNGQSVRCHCLTTKLVGTRVIVEVQDLDGNVGMFKFDLGASDAVVRYMDVWEAKSSRFQ